MKLSSKLSTKMVKGGKIFKNVIQSKVLLYFLSLLSIMNILFFGYVKDYQSVFVFIIIALLMSFFSKNMIIILLVALAFANLIKYVLHKKMFYEGLETMEDEGVELDNDENIDDIEKVLADAAEGEVNDEDEEQVETAKKEEKKELYISKK